MRELSHLMRLGYLVDARDHDEALELVEVAEDLGFDVAWLARPSPLLLLSAAAQRTRRIGLGAAGLELSLENPARLAEDVIALDALSRGRLQVGVTPEGAGAMRIGAAESRERYVSNLAALRRALPRGVGVASRIWQPGSELSMATAAGVAGDGVLLPARDATGPYGRFPQRQVALVGAYRRARRAGDGRVGVVRSVFPAGGDGALTSGLREGLERRIGPLVRKGHYPEGLSAREYLDLEHVALGEVCEVAAALRRDPVLPLATDLVLTFQPAAVTHDQTLALLGVVARDLAPRIGWRRAVAT